MHNPKRGVSYVSFIAKEKNEFIQEDIYNIYFMLTGSDVGQSFYSSNLIKNSLEDEVSASLLSIVFQKQNQIELALDNVFEQAIAISTQPYILETFQEAANNNDQLDPDRLHKISAHLKGIFDRGTWTF